MVDEIGKNMPSGPAEILDTKRGFPVYDRNPSVPVPSSFGTRPKALRVTKGERLMVIGQDTGQILGEGHAGFFEFKEVDETQFVKLYLSGVRQTSKLTAAGLQIFQVVYMQIREKPQADRVEVNPYIVKQYGITINIRTYNRGLREMLEHEFLYRSPSQGVYFVNVGFMFNGNRITLAKTYYLKGTGGIHEELPLLEQQRLPISETLSDDNTSE